VIGGFLGGIIAEIFGYSYVILFGLVFTFFAIIIGISLLKYKTIGGIN